MSVIHDALKTAQRQKQNRDGGASAGSPLFVPRRGGGDSQFNWRNAATIAVASVVIVGATGTLFVRMRNLNPRPLQNIPVAMVPVEPAAEPPRQPAGDAARRVAIAPAPTQDSSPSVASRTVVPDAPRRAPVVASRRAVTPATGSETVIPVTQPVQGGRLRIAVEQPREGDAAQLFAAGVAAHRSGDFAAARSAYDRVLVLVPNDVDALNNLGVVLAATREFDRAEARLRRAVSLAPNHVGAWNNLGTVLAQRGQSGDAIAAFEQTLSLDPQHQGARVSLAQQHLAIGAPAMARQVLEQVLAANPSMAEAHYALGQAYEMEQNWAGAVGAYGAFVRVAPAAFAAHVERVQQRIQLLSARAK